MYVVVGCNIGVGVLNCEIEMFIFVDVFSGY